MTSIYREALGAEFDRLHPKMQWRFGFSSTDQVCQIGRGTMEKVWHGRLFTMPFLLLGSSRRVLFPAKGRQVPFTISNYAYVDSFGRETVTWSRRFKFPRRVRGFDATMVLGRKPGATGARQIIDYLGTHQHLAVDIDMTVDSDGAVCLTSGAQRFHEGPVSFRFPMIFSGRATVREWWDAESEVFRIRVHVANRVFGPLFGYEGSFTVTETACSKDQIPLDVMPFREERRE